MNHLLRSLIHNEQFTSHPSSTFTPDPHPVQECSCHLTALTSLRVVAMLGLAVPAFAQHHYQQTNLVSDVPGMAAATDASLVNPWGLSRSATSPWWAADNR